MLKTRLFLVITTTLLLSATAQAELAARLFVNGAEGPIHTGQPELWELEIYDTDTGERLEDFVAAHKKFMHLVVIRDDLSEFSHFHPFYDPSTGLFQTIVNLPTVNPDNQAATHAVPQPGHYLVFAEVKSKKYGLQGFRIPVTTVEEGRSTPLTVDEPNADGEIIKYFDAAGNLAEAGADYRVRFSYGTIPGDGGELVRFFVTFENRTEDNRYEEVEQLQKWLMMGGHAIIASSSRGDDRLYGHFHSGWPEQGGLLTFSYFNRGELHEEPNKVWFQFRHHNVIYTVPVVFDYSRNQ